MKYILLSLETLYPLFSPMIRKDNICKWEFDKFSNVLIKKILINYLLVMMLITKLKWC
jgi:hypothetical protein